MELARAREEYLSYLAVERGCSANTVAAYGRDLARYVAWLAERGVTEPDGVSLALVEEHVAELSASGLAASSVERAASAVKGFHRFYMPTDDCADAPHRRPAPAGKAGAPP